MSAFKKIGPAIGAMSAAISPAGGAGLQAGDVRLFDKNPGAGWVGENDAVLYDPKLSEVLLPANPQWIDRTVTSATSTFYSVAYGNGVFVAVGFTGQLYTSTNGTIWITRNSQTTQSLNCVIYANGLFVAVGGGGTVVTSATGIIWQPRSYPHSSAINAVAFGAGVFVAAGLNGQIAYSSDAINWTARSSSPSISTVHGLAFFNGSFVAVGGDGAIATSTPSSGGHTWIVRSSPTTNLFYAVLYDSEIGRLIAVGVNGTVAISTDAINWRLSGYVGNGSNSFTIRSIAYANGMLITAGNGGHGALSSDGDYWELINYPTNITVIGLAYGSGKYIAVGTSRLILEGLPRLKGVAVARKPPSKQNWTAYTRIAA